MLVRMEDMFSAGGHINDTLIITSRAWHLILLSVSLGVRVHSERCDDMCELDCVDNETRVVSVDMEQTS